MVCLSFVLSSQVEPPNGLRSYSPNVWALTGGTIHIDPISKLENGLSLVWEVLF